jgi:hypothetical protein
VTFFLQYLKLISIMNFLIGGHPLYADPIPIESLDKLEEHVRALRASGIRADEIGIILDFHGVITNETHHASILTLKGNIKRVLNYFLEERIAVALATAWLNFTEFIEGVRNLELSDHFEIDGDLEVHPKDYFVGEESSLVVKGYKNGRAVALKYAHDKGRDPFFRQKVHALEVTHPGQVFKYVIATDDDQRNLRTIENDFPSTAHATQDCKLILFHLTSKKESSPIASRWVEGPPSPDIKRWEAEISPRNSEDGSQDESNESTASNDGSM